MKKLFFLFVMLFAFQLLNAQTTITVGAGTPTLDGVLSPGEWNATSITTSNGVTLNSMADGQYLYIAAHWTDATESIHKNKLSYDGSTWTKSGDEDRIAFFFDMGLTGTDGANCATFCHIPLMNTTSGKADLWHWKAVRSNPMGYVDDNYVDSLNRQGDPGTSAAADNLLVNGKPSFMSLNGTNANPDFLTKDDAAFSAFDPYGVLTAHTYNKSVAFDSLATFNNGDFIPGFLSRIPTDDRASVRAAGKWESGAWTVEFMKPYDGTANDFAVVPGSSVTFTCEIFDNEGATHWQNGFDATVYTLDFSAIPVPVELVSFNAISQNGIVNLQWATATEINNQGFEVQRKFGSNDFVTVGSVNGHGTTTSPNQYTFTDKILNPGKYVYRLKQIDFDGSFAYSSEVNVDANFASKYSLEQNYPNPFNPSTKITFSVPQSNFVSIEVYNSIGQKIATLLNEQMDAGNYSINFDAANLTSGMYFYKMTSGNFSEIKKMILVK